MNLAKLWNPREAFRDWIINAYQRPLFKISYGIKEQPTEVENLPSTQQLAQELQSAVEDWDRLWLKAMDQKDDVPHNRIEQYVAALQVVQDHQTAHVEFEIRDWTDHALKPLQPILDIRADESNTPLEKIQRNVFAQLLDELAIQSRTIRLSPTSTKVAALTQNLHASVAASVATLEPPAEGPSDTPGPTATVSASATPSSSATATPNPIQVVRQLQSVATDAVDKNQLDLAVTVQKQLQTTLDNVETQPRSEQATKLVNSLQGANAAITKAINSKSGKGRIYMHIANESQRGPARKLQQKLVENQFVVIGIQNVGGRAYIPDTAEVRFFAFPNPAATKKAAIDIVEILKNNGASKVRPSYVIPTDRDKNGADINTRFEIWFARDSFAELK